MNPNYQKKFITMNFHLKGKFSFKSQFKCQLFHKEEKPSLYFRKEREENRKRIILIKINCRLTLLDFKLAWRSIQDFQIYSSITVGY